MDDDDESQDGINTVCYEMIADDDDVLDPDLFNEDDQPTYEQAILFS